MLRVATDIKLYTRMYLQILANLHMKLYTLYRVPEWAKGLNPQSNCKLLINARNMYEYLVRISERTILQNDRLIIAGAQTT